MLLVTKNIDSYACEMGKHLVIFKTNEYNLRMERSVNWIVFFHYFSYMPQTLKSNYKCIEF